MKHILAISGSTRIQSSNQSILHFIDIQFSSLIDLEIFDGIDKLPHFNPDLDQGPVPESVIQFREKIQLADAIIICTPEYVFSLPGSLKNAIEWTVSTTVFSNKPTALIVAAASGQKAFEALDLIMTTLEAKMNPELKLLIQGIKGKIDKDKRLENEPTKENIKALLSALINRI